MTSNERQTYTQLKDGQDRTLRSASPAIKRPASDMGAQDREEHGSDVVMSESSVPADATGTSQQDNSQLSPSKQENGKRLRGDDASELAAHTSDSRSMSQLAPLDDSTSTATASLVPSSSSRASTTATSLYEPSVPPEQLPSIDEQVQKITTIAQSELKDKQKGFVVSSKWLGRVQARSSQPPQGKSPGKVPADGPIGPVDNTDIAVIIEDSGTLKDEMGEPFVELRPGLTIGEDFEVVPQEAWDLIISWYGLARTSPVVTRYAHDTSETEIPNILWELSPPIWSFLKVPSTHTPQTQKEKDLPPAHMVQSRYTMFQTWLKQAKELVHIDMATKVRVWRILGGLKSTTASGILTPAASRSASPAPGAELVANAGDSMLLDVNTFAALTKGEHRELLEAKDHTSDPKYNGKITLATIGLGRNDVIVLEEQTSKNEEWPSENVKLSFGKSLKVKGLTVSGRSSPTPSGMITRGRQKRDGRPRGMAGLSNLGNTCYMNSALQSIRSVEELTRYFLSDHYKHDLNPDNPLGHHGNVAKAYADLIHNIYGDNISSFNPSRFKATIGRYGQSFSGYGQQDSQEFLLFLLDGLHEDLNRIHKKPYIEKPDSTDEMVHDAEALKTFADKNWEIYKARNDSVITDLFAGMYKSTVTCPVCDKVSIIFDPFNNLTLQLPIENNWQKEIIYFPLGKRPYKIDVDIDKNSSIKALKDFVSKRTNYDPDKMIMAESYKNKFFKTFNNNETISEVKVGQHDIICIYELDEAPTNYNPNKKKKASLFSLSYSREADDELVSIDSPEADRLLVPVYHRIIRQSTTRTQRTFFGHPSYVVITRHDSMSYDRVVRRLLNNVSSMTTRDIFEDMSRTEDPSPEDSGTLVTAEDASDSASNHPTAVSVSGEDGLVDVSMRDPSQPPSDDEMDTDSSMQTGDANGALPHSLRHLFEIRIAATGEGIPTGWNSIEENKEYASIKERLPQDQRRGSSDSGATGSTSADEVTEADDEDTNDADGSASETGGSVKPLSEDESDLPDASDLLGKDRRGLSKHQRKKTYSRKHRGKARMLNGRRVQNVPPQPQPKTSAKSTRQTEFAKTNALVRPGEALILDWDQDAYDALFGGLEHESDTDEMRGAPTWKELDTLADEELTARRSQRLNRHKNGITLDDCLAEFGKTETLSEQNAWYCPRCKEHRLAKKQFELWKAPDILVMHLKRFSSNRTFRDKLEVRVDYPVEGLDLSEMVKDQSDGRSLIYDLVAVDNHYGGLGGGHYTAYARNFVNDTWYDFNDSHVSQKDADSVVTSAAYLLFYRRRSDHLLGGPNLEEALAEANSEGQAGSRDPSPSGEGQRLGDSSHNGLSSAYLADPAHHVGDGGSALVHGPLNRGPTPEDDDLSRPIVMRRNSDLLPSYERSQDTDMLLDEGIDVTAPAWSQAQPWSWANVPIGAAGHANSDADNSSTRGEGASLPGSLDGMADSSYLHSEDVHDFQARGLRESAPPPDVPSVRISAANNEDEEEELPVAELHADPSGDLEFKPVKS